MSNLTRPRQNTRDLMAIGFLAPQHAETPQDQRLQSHERQDSRIATFSRAPLDDYAHAQHGEFAYRLNVQASMNLRQCGTSQPTPSMHNPMPWLQSHPGSSMHSGMSTTPPDQAIFGGPDRTPRERRDPYSEEMQFFIMFSRIMKEHDWRKIEDDFERIFQQRRPRDGLTAVYYRIRNKWGMQQVLKSDLDKYQADFAIVERQSKLFSQDFLYHVGYYS